MRDIGQNKRVIRTEKKSCGCSKNRKIDNTYKVIKANYIIKKKKQEVDKNRMKKFL
jgi:hypothetical protein